MTEPRFADRTWPEIDAARRGPLVAFLPVGSTEAHGPHLPLGTDVLIAEGMAAEAARRLAARGVAALCLPALPYTVTDCARAFAGTVTVGAETVRRLLGDVLRSLAQQGVSLVVLANGHLEPAHRRVLADAAEEAAGSGLRVLFPDYVRRPHVARLGAEFQSGACHAGSYETSLVLALRPELVRLEQARRLPPNDVSLVQAFQEGKHEFREAGGPQAYFGAPAEASAEEGRRLLDELASILVEAVDAALRESGPR